MIKYMLQSDPDVMKYIGKGVRTESEVQDGLNKAMIHYEKHGFSLGNVYLKENRQFIGRAGLIYLGYNDAQPEVELGYALLKEHWGQGYAYELASASIDWGFKHLKLPKLVAVTRRENSGSRRVLEKAGMVFTQMTHYWNQEVCLYEITAQS